MPRSLFDGTKLSGFVKASQNEPPRQCSNCIWYKDDSCGHPIVKLDPELQHIKLENGRIPVDDKDCCNGFQSEGTLLAYGLRHGSTELNADNSFRGWMDVPLDEEGNEQAKAAAEFFEGKGISRIICSDLIRARETAHAVADELNLPVTIDSDLRPWNIGYLSGKPKGKYQKELNGYIDHPEEKVPDGESLKEFAQRFQCALKKYLDEAESRGEILLLVFHTSNIIQSDAFCEDENGYGRPEDAEVVSPGGAITLSKSGDDFECEPVLGNVDEGQYGS